MNDPLGRALDALFEAAVKPKLGLAISAVLYLTAGAALVLVSVTLQWYAGRLVGYFFMSCAIALVLGDTVSRLIRLFRSDNPRK